MHPPIEYIWFMLYSPSFPRKELRRQLLRDSFTAQQRAAKIHSSFPAFRFYGKGFRKANIVREKELINLESSPFQAAPQTAALPYLIGLDSIDFTRRSVQVPPCDGQVAAVEEHASCSCVCSSVSQRSSRSVSRSLAALCRGECLT
jgi:hypothetical protein